MIDNDNFSLDTFGKTEFDYDLYNKVYEKAISIISMATQSEKNLRMKLAKNSYPQEMVDKVIEELKSNGFVDDLQNGRVYAINLYQFKNYGRIKVAQKLQQRGIDYKLADEIAKATLEECGGEEEIAKIYLEKKPDLFELLKENKQKFYTKLLSRGFSSSTIKKVSNIEYLDE